MWLLNRLGREFECCFWMSVFEICHLLSSKVTTWHTRGHRLLRVALSEISGLGPKWSFATDTQRILNIWRRISPRWRFWSVAWPNLIKDFLDVQIIKNACFWQWRKFQVIHCTCSKNINQYNALWAKNERAQERCRRLSCTCHVG